MAKDKTVITVEATSAPELKTKKFNVNLPHNPEKAFEAESREQAVAKYKEHFGILSTNHEFVVHELN